MKAYCAPAATEVAMEAVQILGGNGYMREYRVEQLARDAKLLQIGGGTDEILSGGEYDVQSLIVAAGAQVVVEAPSAMVVVGTPRATARPRRLSSWCPCDPGLPLARAPQSSLL